MVRGKLVYNFPVLSKLSGESMFTVYNKDTGPIFSWLTCSKLTWEMLLSDVNLYCSVVIIIDFEHISHVIIVSLVWFMSIV